MLKLNLFSDQKIIERIRQNDRRVLGDIFLRYERLVNSFILRRGGSREDAQDLLQEAVIVLWQKVNAGSFALSSKLSTFILAVVRNKWLAMCRKNQSLSKEDIPEIRDEENIALEEIIEREQMVQLQTALQEISELCRKLLRLFYFEERNMASIADILNLAGADVAKSKKYQCKKRLQELLQLENAEAGEEGK